MDDELKQLEDELRRYRPMAVPPSLLERIEHDLKPRRRPFLLWTPVPGIIALALGAFIVFHAPAGAPAPLRLRAVSADSVVLQSTDDGYFTLSDGSVVQRTRSTSIDTVLWTDPSAHASLTWTVPREDVTVVPLSVQ